MNCDQIAELLPDYLQETLPHDQTVLVETHLQGCTQCAAEVGVWKQLALLPEEQPSPRLRSRFTSMLESYQEGRWEKSSLASERQNTPAVWNLGYWFRLPAMAGAAWACVFLLGGVLIGKSMNKPVSAPEAQQIEAMRGELKTTQKMMVLAMLQLQSAGDRLQGVTISAKQEEADPQVLGALLHTVRYDGNVDVRLAALDALTRYGNRPEVRRGLVEAMDSQQSPMVQIALIDVLVELHDSAALQQFKKFKQDPKANPMVKKHAEWGIQKLT